MAELEGEVARAEELVAGLQAELSGGHGNQESLRKQLVSVQSLHALVVTTISLRGSIKRSWSL